jgi:hypothetical protein
MALDVRERGKTNGPYGATCTTFRPSQRSTDISEAVLKIQQDRLLVVWSEVLWEGHSVHG